MKHGTKHTVFRNGIAALPTLSLSHPVAFHIPIMLRKALNGLMPTAFVSLSATIFSVDM